MMISLRQSVATIPDFLNAAEILQGVLRPHGCMLEQLSVLVCTRGSAFLHLANSTFDFI